MAGVQPVGDVHQPLSSCRVPKPSPACPRPLPRSKGELERDRAAYAGHLVVIVPLTALAYVFTNLALRLFHD